MGKSLNNRNGCSVTKIGRQIRPRRGAKDQKPLPGASRRGPGVRGVKLSPLPRRRVVLIGAGQGCAPPVPPFDGEVGRFPDKPGARPLTCQLFAQIIGPPRAGATGCPGAGWGTSGARQTVEPKASRQEGREAVGLPHTSCPVCRLNRPFPACIRFASARLWRVTPATLERTGLAQPVSAHFAVCS